MPFDDASTENRSLKGRVAYHDGLAAEDAVEAHYLALGFRIVERRWRGAGGEIDLILRDQHGLVFVEVKKAKSHAVAAERLSMRQLQRICVSAEDYCGTKSPGRLVNMRVDLATVDGQGSVEILTNISLI